MNATWTRIVFTLWLGLACPLYGCTLSADTDDRGPLEVRPWLVVPAEVHPGQTFVIEMSGSTIIGADIDGYALRFDRGADVVLVREPRTTHRFDTPGAHVVGLHLMGYDDVEVEATVEVVGCGQPLACLPGRPCPGGDVCVDGRCTAPVPSCTTDADCPDGLRCDPRRACVGADDALEAATCP